MPIIFLSEHGEIQSINAYIKFRNINLILLSYVFAIRISGVAYYHQSDLILFKNLKEDSKPCINRKSIQPISIQTRPKTKGW